MTIISSYPLFIIFMLWIAVVVAAVVGYSYWLLLKTEEDPAELE